MARPEDRFAWTRKTNLKLLKLEREVFVSGYEKAFLLFMDSCNICPECSGMRETCKQPKMARPTPEAMAVDVFATVRKIGYPIEVLSTYDQPMNRYAFPPPLAGGDRGRLDPRLFLTSGSWQE